MDVFKLLKQDHKEVKDLFKKLQSSRPSKSREKGMEQLREALTLHTQVEEQIVYPRLREEKKLRETVNEALEEHHMATLLLEELAQTPMDDERWEAKLSVLKEIVEHHVKEEEKEVFPKATKALDKGEAKELGRRVEEWKTEHQGDIKKGKRVEEQEEGDAHEERAHF